ncbi:restriction endonuclease [Ruminococcus albus SY3]|uniref:Restriction endonuclease n=1 Tax=Ruminococcus albus SY3 TaxID=1341156 RepID=A0A011V5C7_RUMAL|nr:restriction endonuclease [Ruminococcus albus]EXM40712.1 restriction endonuclease [Ruminococcus albus SY3]
MSEEIKVWGIHTYDDNLFLKENVIAIGWNEMGDLSLIEKDREAFKAKYTEVYKDAKKGSIPTCAGMLYRFVNEAKVGDYVVFPSKSNREVNIGQITGEYRYDAEEHDYVQKRDVKWFKHFKRTFFSQGALYEIGAAQSFFLVKNYADEFLSALEKDFKNSFDKELAENDVIAETADEIEQATRDYVLKALFTNFKGYPLENFVANLLEAMGYKTTVSKQGGDNGIDIIAYKDELPPRILVQVKSQNKDISETVVQSFKGAMLNGDYGLFVTLSDYTPNAKIFLEKNPIIKGINGYELVDLIIKYYDKLNEKYQKVIPLKRVYIPVSV